MQKITLLLLINFLINYYSFGQKLPTEKAAKLDSLFSLIEKSNKGMGSVSIFQNGEEIYTKQYGFLSIQDGIKADKNTKYRIGSMSKMFTAIIILKQIENKKLGLETKLNTFFPTIPNSEKITIELLLRHRSGIPNYTDLPDYNSWSNQPMNQQELLNIITSLSSKFMPNEKFEYSNSNFLILSFIAQEIDNLSFEKLLEKYITRPAKLKNTYISEKLNVANSEAFSYQKMVYWELSPETNPMITLGAGAITSTPHDVNLFFTKLFEGKLINKQSLSLLPNFQDGHSLGFQEFVYKDLKGIGHGGKVDGFNSYSSYFSDKKTSVVFTSNAILYPMYDIWIGIISIIFDYPFHLPVFRSLSNEELKKFEGTYANENFPFKFYIKVIDGMLVMEGDGHKFSLEYENGNTFKLDMIGLVLEFIPNQGKMLFKQGGGEFEFEKE